MAASGRCVSCAAEVDPPNGWTGPICCGRCWYAATGDYPGRLVGNGRSKRPHWLANVTAPRTVDLSRPIAGVS